MAQTRTVLANDDATHVRVALGSAEEIAQRAKKKGVAAWVIVEELLEVTREEQR